MKSGTDTDVLGTARVLAGRASPGEQIEVFAARGTDTHLLVRDQAVEAVTTACGGGVGIRVLRGNRMGFAHTNAFDPHSLESALAEARSNARYSAPSDAAVLAVPDGVPAAPLELWRDDVPALAFEDKLRLARDLERRLLAVTEVAGIKSVTWGDSTGESAVVSSTGVESQSCRSSCFLSAYVIGADDGGRTATSTAYTTGRGPSELDPAGAAAEAIRSLPASRSSRLAPQRLPVILGPRATAAFLPVVSGMINRAAEYPNHLLGTAPPGTTVAATALSLTDDPTDPTAFGAARYDSEGLATRSNRLIEQGRIAGRLHDAAGGRRAGTRSNGAAFRAGYKSAPRAEARALSIRPGDLDPRDAPARLGHGFWVQDVIALEAGGDPAYGGFSAAVSGRMIRNGEPTEWVPHTTVASTVPALLLGIRDIGSDSSPLPGRAKGTTLILSELALGGVSTAR